MIIAKVHLQRRVPKFHSTELLQVPKGHYVEMNFTMKNYFASPCLDDVYLEIRDGYNKSANLLGKFCEMHISSIVRSSGPNMWLKYSSPYSDWFSGKYRGKAANITGKYCVGVIKKFPCNYLHGKIK